MTVALVLASVALAVALTAAVGVIVLMRQNADTTSDLRRHRRAHTEAFGYPDPRLDRRQVNIGAPRATGERRGTRYEPPAERLAPRPDVVEVDEPLTAERADQLRHASRPSEPDPFSPTNHRDPRDDVDEVCGEPHPNDPDRRCVLPAGHDSDHRLTPRPDPADDTPTGELDRTDLPTVAAPAIHAPQRPRPRPREDTPT